MNPPRYVHLRLHSEYSVTDGIVRIGDAVKRAAADGMPAMALTDLANLFGLVKFYTGRAARASSRLPVPMCGSPIRRRPRMPIVFCCWCVIARAISNCASC